MNYRQIIVFIGIAFLTIAFSLVSLALYLSKGKSKYWTTKKMKFGAIILSLTAMTATQSCNTFTTCYESDIQNYIYLKENLKTLNLKTITKLSGTINNRTGDTFSYKLQNEKIDSIFQIENIVADDGAFDEYDEDFTLNLNQNLVSGSYILKFYDIEKSKIDNISLPLNEYRFQISN